jgi:hypothetical protein
MGVVRKDSWDRPGLSARHAFVAVGAAHALELRCFPLTP